MLAFQLESKLGKSGGSEIPDFTSMESTAQQTVALERPIFKREKGFTNLSLGLI
jgi:hypothetical protein